MSTPSTSPAKKPAAAKTPRRSRATPATKAAAAEIVSAGRPAAAAGDIALNELDTGHFVNPRGQVDETGDRFLELVESIRSQGVLQPILVGATLTSGKLPLVCGWTRVTAARAAGLTAIPYRQDAALTSAAAARAASAAENIARQDMSPLAEARVIDDMMRLDNLTQAQVARAIGMGERTVRERLRLLKIQADAPVVAAAIDAGTVPMRAAVVMQKIAAVSPELAASVAQVANDDDIAEYTRGDLADEQRVAGLLKHTSFGDDIAPLEIPYNNAWSAYQIDRSAEQLGMTAEQVKRWKKVPPEHAYYRDAPSFVIPRAALAKLATQGKVIELDSARGDVAKFVARDAVPALVEDTLQAMEKAGAKRSSELAAQQKAEANAKAAAEAPKAKEQARKEREREKREREIAHHRNVLIGERATPALMAELAATLPVAKALAIALLKHEGSTLLNAGVRFTDAAHLTETTNRNGVKRAYQTPYNLPAKLTEEINAATTPAQALGVVLRLFAAAEHVDQAVVAQSARTQYWGGSHGRGVLQALKDVPQIVDGLDDEAKARAASSIATDKADLDKLAGDATPAAAALKGLGKQGKLVVEHVIAKPGITVPEIADQMGVRQNSIYRLIADLLKRDAIHKQGTRLFPGADQEAAK